MKLKNEISGQRLGTLGAILAVWILLSFQFLFAANMGGEGWNEVDVLPLARQFVDPSWLPNDWYLNQPAGYRLLFLGMVGWLINTIGFLGTSIFGRLVCYALVATGLVGIAQCLRLRLPFLLVSIGLFVLPYRFDWGQGVIAAEWLVGGFEPKAMAYGFVLMAIACLLMRRYRQMAVLLGLATSFHVLVGGWSALVSLGWFLLKPKRRFPSLAVSLQALGLYILTSAFAIPAVLRQLFSPSVEGDIPSSYIYVFWRLPHHLNPLGWSWESWLRLMVYLVLFSLCMVRLRFQYTKKPAEAIAAQFELAEWTLISLIPFGLGLAIAPFDTTGSFLQYYPFRLGDVMIRLTTYLLLLCQFQQIQVNIAQSVRQGLAWIVLTLLCLTHWGTFQQDVAGLRTFPASTLDEGRVWVNTCDWIREHTPQDAIFLAPPESHSEFTWIAEHARIVDYKLFPQTAPYILEWYERLNDVTGNDGLWPPMGDRSTSRNLLRNDILELYKSLSTREVNQIVNKYTVDYVLTLASARPLELPIVYENKDYVLYQIP